MAHNTRIKPQASDTVGLSANYARIGTDLKNAAVVASHFMYNYASDTLSFDAVYLFNNAAADSWLIAEGSVQPIRTDNITITGINLDISIVDQCLNYLLTMTQFNGSQGGGSLIWVKA